MGSLIGILSTVILVSTVCTLIFAVGAYAVSRKNRNGVGVGEELNIPGTDVADAFPQRSAAQGPSLFKRVQPVGGGHEVVSENSNATDDYQWK